MPPTLDTPVLQVDANVIHKVDTRNPQNLFSMWTVFARCGGSVAQGRRLENLSWRLWTRETFCCEDGDVSAITSPKTVPKDIGQAARSSTEEMPQLSGSVDSVADDEAAEFASEPNPLEMAIARPMIERQDSCASNRSRGRERHITSDDLEKMVTSIVEEKELPLRPLPELASAAPAKPPTKDVDSPPADVQRSGSTTTEESAVSTDDDASERRAEESSQQQASPPEPPIGRGETTVVRGFLPSRLSPCQLIVSPPESSPDPIPGPEAAPAARPVLPPKKQAAIFALGGSSSGGEESPSESDHHLDASRMQPVPQPKRKIFQVGGSSEEESSLKSALHSSRPGSLLSAQKKQASFSNQVTLRTVPNSAVGDDQSETDYVDESAIDDDDDSSDWEDSGEDSGKSSIDEKTFFQRVDSKANLTSRRSLITLMLEQNDRSKMLGNAASQSTSALPRARSSHRGPLVASPNDSDEAPLMMKRGLRGAPLKPINEIPRSSAQPIVYNAPHGQQHQAALSPRTTRRNMLHTELTESLRRHLLWERQQKSSTANAVLKRRHTSHDVANLKQYPEKPYMKKAEDVNASSWDQYFTKEAFSGYHSKGW